MHRQIAAFIGYHGMTADVNESGRVVVYERKYGKWNVLREKQFMLGEVGSIKDLRKKMEELVLFLKATHCRIFVGATVTGIPYFELEKNDFRIWEYQGKPDDFLDYILTAEKKQERKKCQSKIDGEQLRENQPTVEPVEISPGCYHISLKEIQGGKAGLTSKQALLPFLRQGKFYSLQVECTHVPMWLEGELMAGKLQGEVAQGQDTTVVTISKSTCD